MLKKWAYKKADTELIRWQNPQLQRYESGNIKSGVKFRGGEVLSPSAVGMHLNVTCWDVASMYPTMSIVHNISPETINCDCCKDDPEAKIDQKIMVYINEGLAEKDKLDPGLGWAPRPFHYWICRKQEGILKQIMKDLFKKKSEFKKQGLRLEEKAVKILANSGYGVFGKVNFEHYNVGVTEVITAFARYSLLGIKREIELLVQQSFMEILIACSLLMTIIAILIMEPKLWI